MAATKKWVVTRTNLLFIYWVLASRSVLWSKILRNVSHAEGHFMIFLVVSFFILSLIKADAFAYIIHLQSHLVPEADRRTFCTT